MSSIDQSNTTQQNNTMSELNNPKKRGKNKQKKGQEDNVMEAGMTGGQDDFQPTKKRRRGGKDKGDKDKNKQDDLAEGTITGTGPVKSKKRKQKKTDDGDPTTTVNQQTDFGTSNPTQKDLL